MSMSRLLPKEAEGIMKRCSMNMWTSSLPQEVIMEILLRLPVKSLLKFRCVCKSWRTLMSHPNFINSHLQHSIQKHNINLFFQGGTQLFHLQSPIDFRLPHYQPLKLDISFPSRSDYMRIVNSCNGLICLITYCNRTVYIVNPSTRSCFTLPDLPTDYTITSTCEDNPGNFDFGYSSHSKYKFLRIFYPPGSKPKNSHISPSEVQVYTLGGTWTRKFLHIPACIIRYVPGTLLNGSIHWLAKRISEFGILSFNLVSEEFQYMPLPEFMQVNCSIHYLNILKGRLTLYGTSDPDEYIQHPHIKIWVMKDNGFNNPCTWIPQFAITQSTLFRKGDFFRPLIFLPNGEILLTGDLGSTAMAIYDPASHTHRDFVIPKMYGAIDYIESLV